MTRSIGYGRRSWPRVLLGLAVVLALALGGIRQAQAYQEGAAAVDLQLESQEDGGGFTNMVTVNAEWIEGVTTDDDGDKHHDGEVAGTAVCGDFAHRIVIDWGDASVVTGDAIEG